MTVKYHKKAWKYLESLQPNSPMIAYDPDYVKLLPDEKAELDAVLADLGNDENFITIEQ